MGDLRDTAARPQGDGMNFWKRTWKGLLRGFWKGAALTVLLVLGLGLIGVGLWDWFDIPDASTTTVTEETHGTEQVVTTTGAQSTDEATAPSASPSGSSSSKKTNASNNSKTETSAGPTWKQTTTETPQASRRSESLTLALCGIGAALVLSGVFYGRISKVSWGAGSVELSDVSAKVSTTVDQHQKVLTSLAVKIGQLTKRVEELEER